MCRFNHVQNIVFGNIKSTFINLRTIEGKRVNRSQHQELHTKIVVIVVVVTLLLIFTIDNTGWCLYWLVFETSIPGL